MRHLKRNAKLGRKGDHRNAMLANLACSLIKHNRITTTLAKAKALRPVAEKLVTLGKKGQEAAAAAASATDDAAKLKAISRSVFCRRLAAARLRQQTRTLFRGTPSRSGKEQRLKWREREDVVHILFDRIAPVFKERKGGYTRITKVGERRGDVAMMAVIEWVDAPLSAGTATAAEAAPAAEKK